MRLIFRRQSNAHRKPDFSIELIDWLLSTTDDLQPIAAPTLLPQMNPLFHNIMKTNSSLSFVRIATAVTALTLGAVALRAGPIYQGAIGAGWQINHYEPIGQSFTAEDANILSIGFNVWDVNLHAGPLDPITVSLYAGAGNGGTLLGSANLQGLVPNYNGWHYADFSFVSLTVGNVYTAFVEAVTARGAINGAGSNPYAGGQAYLQGGAVAHLDLTFHVVPGANNVPDTSVTAPLALVLAGLALVRRRRAA